MALDELKAALPDYAKDLRLNLGSVVGNSDLPEQQLWGTVLACAMATRSPAVLRELEPEARANLKPEAYDAAKGAAAVMGMNNVYYRFVHFMGDSDYGKMPARLRMQVIGNPGVDHLDFELWCLAASAITGCEACVKAHEQTVRAKGGTVEHVQDAVRIAAVVHGVAVAIATCDSTSRPDTASVPA